MKETKKKQKSKRKGLRKKGKFMGKELRRWEEEGKRGSMNSC